MQLILQFADGCTGEDEESVIVTAPKFLWGGLKVWILSAGLADIGTPRRELQDIINERSWVEDENECRTAWMSRGAAQWVMVYFEAIGETRIILRKDEHDVSPLNRVVVDAHRLG